MILDLIPGPLIETKVPADNVVNEHTLLNDV